MFLQISLVTRLITHAPFIVNKIPKKIHYVWGYREPKPKMLLMCLASWKATMPDYEIIEWNQNTIDFDRLAEECPFFKKSMEIGLWAYLSDYIRFKVLYQQGGIYMDTDVQALKSMDALLSHRFFIGFHHGYKNGIPTDRFIEGAVMGSRPGHPFIRDMIDFFQTKMLTDRIAFLPYAINRVLEENYGLTIASPHRKIRLKEGIVVFPPKYFHPAINGNGSADDIFNGIHRETHTIHWQRNSYKDNWKFHLFMNYRNTLPWHQALRSRVIHTLSKIKKSLFHKKKHEV